MKILAFQSWLAASLCGAAALAGIAAQPKGNDVLERADDKSPLRLRLGGPEYPDDSDHASFSVVGVPILYVCTGSHQDRHTPGDSADKINFEGMVKIVDLCEDVLDRLLVVSRPTFVPPPSRKSSKASN